MNIEEVLHAMPKVELNLNLDGAFKRETLLLIAEQNDITPITFKKFKDWMALLSEPQPNRLNDLAKTIYGWFLYPDDITRLVYDAGVYLAKQNVRYAEVLVSPVYYMLPTMQFDDFMSALNDGRDRVERGWGVNMKWILSVPRYEPRRADEIARWATSATGRKNHVIGFGLTGPQEAQPAAQFERAFNTAHKKGLPTVAQAVHVVPKEDEAHPEDLGIRGILTHLNPERVLDGWGMLASSDLLDTFSGNRKPLVVSLNRAKWMGQVKDISEYPLAQLYDENINVVLSSDMPTIYGTSLTDEYVAAINECGMTLEQIQEMVINSVMMSFLPEDEKAGLATSFLTEFEEIFMDVEDDVDMAPEVE